MFKRNDSLGQRYTHQEWSKHRPVMRAVHFVVSASIYLSLALLPLLFLVASAGY